jgi:hypothetical protein
VRALAARLGAEYRARRTFRAMCRAGLAPRVSVDIHLETDHGDDWSNMTTRGLYGLKTSRIPLTRRGVRYLSAIPRDIRATCIRELREWERRQRR